jgi:aldehyde:ferredoxin oxidoreductase
MGPWIASPLKERNYSGDDSIESLLYSLATGDKKSREELDEIAERIFTLHRALTIRDMETKDMRTQHDTIPDWVFTDPAGKKCFTPGTNRMDEEDMKLAMDMYYEAMGWDKKSGSPTNAAYQRLGLRDVADALKNRGLIP